MARHSTALGLIGTGLAAALVLTAIPATVAATPSPPAWSSGVDSWVTDLNTDQRLARQPSLRWQDGAGAQDAIVVDPTRRYQKMTGFGASMTDSSAYVLSRLPAKARTSIMTDLFSTREGIGLSMLRQPMGASDFAVGQAYSYDDQPTGKTDRDLSDFSIAHDRAYILPRLREAYAINPDLTFMASPWSAPGWMKDTDSLVQGSLRKKYEKAYAQYFVKFVRAYAKAGIPTDYVSLQNEPLYEPEDYPGHGGDARPSSSLPRPTPRTGAGPGRPGRHHDPGLRPQLGHHRLPGGDLPRSAGGPLRARHGLALLRR